MSLIKLKVVKKLKWAYCYKLQLWFYTNYKNLTPKLDHYRHFLFCFVSGGHQWNHLNSGSSHGEAVCRWRLPHRLPCHRPLPGWHWHQQGKGSIFYRQTESPTVLKRAEADVKRGFPDATFTPTHAFIATWENVSAYEEVTRSSSPSNRVRERLRAVLNVTLEVWLGVIKAGHLWSVCPNLRPRGCLNVQ